MALLVLGNCWTGCAFEIRGNYRKTKHYKIQNILEHSQTFVVRMWISYFNGGRLIFLQRSLNVLLAKCQIPYTFAGISCPSLGGTGEIRKTVIFRKLKMKLFAFLVSFFPGRQPIVYPCESYIINLHGTTLTTGLGVGVYIFMTGAVTWPFMCRNKGCFLLFNSICKPTTTWEYMSNNNNSSNSSNMNMGVQVQIGGLGIHFFWVVGSCYTTQWTSGSLPLLDKLTWSTLHPSIGWILIASPRDSFHFIQFESHDS